MILEVLVALIAVGTIASAAMALRVAPLYSSLMSFAVWIVIAYSATSVDLVTDAGALEEGVSSEPALAVLAFGNAAISLLIVVAAAIGEYGDDEQEHGTDRPVNPDSIIQR